MDENKEASIKSESNVNGSSEITEAAGFVDTVEKNSSTWQEQYFYKISADATLYFKNGDIIKVNKGMLGFHSHILSEFFYGSSSINEIVIEDFDSETFKLFLNCLFGFEDYTVKNALLIYPIAHKFEVKKSLDDCIGTLKPSSSTAKDENIILALNLAVFYNCESLIASLVEFLMSKFGILNLFESEDYLFLLEPAALLNIIEQVDMNSFFLEKIYNWGENYLGKHNSRENIRSFLSKHDIFQKIPLITFESLDSVLVFHHIISQKKLYTSGEILLHMENNISRVACELPIKSSWLKMSKGDVLNEKIDFQYALSSPDMIKGETTLKIWRNSVICNLGDTEKEKENKKMRIFTYEWCYFYKEEISTNGSDYKFNKIKSEVFTATAVDSKKKFAGQILKHPNCSIISIEVTYTFNIECRILKTTLNTIPLAVNDSELYFTRGIKLS